MMKATNMTASMAVNTLSARRRNQPAILTSEGCIRIRRTEKRSGSAAGADRPAARGTPLLQGVDLLQHSGRPSLCLVRGEVHLLRVLAERLDIRGVNLQASLLEAIDEFRLGLQMFFCAPGHGLVGRFLE